MKRDARTLGSVPAWLWTLLFAALFAQVAWRAAERAHAPVAVELPPRAKRKDKE